MKVWTLQTGEPLHADSGSPRMRAMNLANSLVEAGHEVTVFSSDFSHKEKRTALVNTRCLKSRISLSIGSFQVQLSRHIGLKRLFDHWYSAEILLGFQHEYERPDVAFVGYPPIEIAYRFSFWLAQIYPA